MQTGELIARGVAVYQAQCFSCHGDATTPPPVPAAPTHATRGHTWRHPDRVLVERVLDGAPFGGGMPPFRGVLTEDEVRAAIAYLKTFWSSSALNSQAVTSSQYERARR